MGAGRDSGFRTDELRRMIPNLAQHFSSVPQVKEFFLARQPILDRNERLVAYELLFRRPEAGPAQ